MEPTPDAVERELQLARAAYTPGSELRERVLDKVLRGAAIADARLAALNAPDILPGSGRRGLRAAGLHALVAVGLVSLGFAAGLQVNAVPDAPPPLPAPRNIAQDSILVPEPLPPIETEETITEPPANDRRARLAQGGGSRMNDGHVARAPRPGTPGAVPPRSKRPPPLQPRSGSAREELALLGRAERAVRAGNSALGLALIAELEAGYPRSKLLEERRAVELMAHCAAEATDGRTRAERFLRAQPRSIYAARIEELCGVSTPRPQH